ncbi:MAG: Tfp pilus assembly protein FimT/FimU [bacterium]
MATSHAEEAFTLVELVIVVALVGILASAVVPKFGGSLSKWRANMYARSLWSSLRGAKLRAVGHEKPVTVHMDITNGGTVNYFTNTKQDGTGTWELISGLAPMNMPSSVEIHSVGSNDPDDDSGRACIKFMPDGSIPNARTSAPGDRDCDGSDLGNPVIHIAGSQIDLDASNECVFTTIFIDSSWPSPQPNYIAYGAYDEFSPNNMGEEPGDC